jgi:hypothetical protein
VSPGPATTSTTSDTRRVVVYGEYPPYTTPGAAATLATVRSLLAAGTGDGVEIEVASPKPSATHHHADVGNPIGAARLARLVGGADLVARFDPGILGEAGGAGPAAARAAVALAVRRARSATIELSPLTAPPSPRWVRSILGRAERVVVAGVDDADRLRAAGLDAARLSVSGEAWWLPASEGGPPAGPSGGSEPAARAEPWAVAPGATREDIEAEVRRRAAAHRETDTANPVSASWPLHMLAPLAPAPTGSSKPLFRLIKRYVHRLVAWEVVPIVEQVNHLQRATIESLDRHAEALSEAQRPPAETTS